MNGDPEIIVRRKRSSRGSHGGHGGHGGSWKIAFADFMTAMMALFLLLWLVNITSEEQRKGIADFFNPMAFKASSAGGEGAVGGVGLGGEAAEPPPPPTGNVADVQEANERQAAASGSEGDATGRGMGDGGTGRGSSDSDFAELVQEIKERISVSIDLQELAENVVIEVVDEGLRIQITDREGAPMFPVGSTGMTQAAAQVVQAVASTVAGIPNRVAVTGHTDGIPYRGDSGFDNWDLSSGRANAARRILMAAGIGIERISRVEGLADTDHLVRENPNDPRNRRISIMVLRR